MKLNLGCGDDYRRGWVNADVRPEVRPDVVVHMDAPYLPFDDEQFDEVLLDNVLEHSTDLFALLREIHRVTEPGGRITFRGPHWHSVGAWTDPTHTRPFTRETFQHELVADLFRVLETSCTRIRFGRLFPESVALALADHVGHLVSEIEVVVECRPTHD